MRVYVFRDVATGRISKISASSGAVAVRRYARRRKGKYLPNFEFVNAK